MSRYFIIGYALDFIYKSPALGLYKMLMGGWHVPGGFLRLLCFCSSCYGQVQTIEIMQTWGCLPVQAPDKSQDNVTN